MFLIVKILDFNETGKKSDHLDSKHSCPLKVSLSFFIGVFVTSLKKKLALRISVFSLTRKRCANKSTEKAGGRRVASYYFKTK